MNAELAQAQTILNSSKRNPDKALKILKPLLKRQNKPWTLYHFLGVAQLQKQNYQKAIGYLTKATELGGDEPETFHLASMGYKELGKYDEAIRFAYEALKRNDQFVQAWINLGAVYRDKADLDNSLKAYQRANQLDPKNAGIAFRLASIYTDQGDHPKGQKLYEITIKMDPAYIEAYLGLAQIHQKYFRFEQAIETIQEALEHDPKSLIARVELASAYKALGDYDEAIRINEELIKEYPRIGLIRVNYALCFQETARFNEAEENYRKAFEVDPSISESISNYLMAIHYNPERTKQEIFDAHLLWDQHFAPKERPVRPVPENIHPQKKLRVGFLSGGFRKHPVGWMIVRAIENLPDDQIEVYGYTTHSMHDAITARIQEKSKKWTSVIGYNDEVVANLIREDEIDILVELSGHASLNRLKTVALEPAPITVKWVGGLFNTTGLKSMDYLLTDHFESPEGEEGFYTEKLVRMPDDYIVYQVPTYGGIEVEELPAKKNGYVTFGCFNNPTKINPVLLEQWADIMHQVPDSKLFLKSKQYETNTFVQNIIEVMAGFGIGEERLIFEGQSLHDALLKSYNRIDVALDPWPYSGGLTTCEALWMGVPVVTNSGPTFAGRHSASHLVNAGFPEWVTDNWKDYKNAVLHLISDLDRLQEIRVGLRNKVLDSPLCDGKKFAAHLSVAFREMWKQRVQGYEKNLAEGEWQDHIQVRRLSDSEVETISSGCVFSPKERGVTESLVIENKLVRNKQGLQVSVPENVKELTSYVYAEKNTWLDNEIDFVSGFLRKGMAAIDVGAGYGAYAVPMGSKVGFQGKVYAFEPILEMAQHIQESSIANNFGQIEVIPKAVSLEKGFISFKEEENAEFSYISSAGNSTVESIALDEFWLNENRPDIDLLKIDVNGSEVEVLESALGLISDQKPVLVASLRQDSEGQNRLTDSILKLGYQLFEYVSELQVLAPYEGQPSSSFASNLIGISTEDIEAGKFSDWIFSEPKEIQVVDSGSWKNFVSNLTWVKDLPVNWEDEVFSNVSEQYLSALDYITNAEDLLRNPFSEYRKSNIQATEWMLTAAGKLIDLLQQGNQSIPLELTLSRVLLKLGKRNNAITILKGVVERLLSGTESVDFKTPFLLPFSDQDFTTSTHDPVSWLKVKGMEAWLLLKEKSTYFSQAKDIQYLHGLSGNPDSLPLIDKIVNDLIPARSSEPKEG
ncbi:MAG: FkbM family methyltransferase, partial [Balneolales bacterium]|nr:FkbM family methyltransferase [Balneolales bacterium]